MAASSTKLPSRHDMTTNAETIRLPLPVTASNATTGVSLLFVVTCAAQPFFWIRAPFIALSIPTIACLVFLLAGTLNPQRLFAAHKRFFMEAFWFHCSFLLYLLSLVIATLYLQTPGLSLRPLGAMILSAACYFGIGARLMEFENATIGKSLLYGFGVGTTAFILYSLYIFASLDQRQLEIFWQPINAGTTQFGSRFMRIILNYAEGTTVSGAPSELKGSTRNTLAVCLTFLFFASLPNLAFKGRSRLTYLIAVAAVILCPALTLLLSSRSSLISLAIGICLSNAILLLYSRSDTVIRSLLLQWILIATGLLLAMLALLLLERNESNMATALNLDLQQNIRNDPRIRNYLLAVDEISKSPIIGAGVGARLADGHTVHNFILGAWVEAGAAGLICSSAMYLLLIGLWIKRCLAQFSSMSLWTIGEAILVASAASMLVGPIIRRMLSGNAGRFTIIELIALAVFIAFTRIGSQRDDGGQSEVDRRNC